VTCRESADFIMDCVCGDQSSEALTEFEYHLSLCRNCVRYFASYRDAVKLGKRAFDDSDELALPAVPEELVRAVLAFARARSATSDAPTFPGGT
jgi:hypothetical protein